VKFRFLGVILSTLCLSNVVISGDGFYAGASLGMTNLYTQVDAQISAASNEGFPVTDTFSFGRVRPNGSLFAGYHFQVLDKAYIDTELYVLYQNTQINCLTENPPANWRMGANVFAKKKSSYGITFLVGTPISKISSLTSIYLSLGIETAGYEASAIGSPVLPTGNLKRNKNYVSFVPGVGVKLALTEELFLRGGYSYAQGPSLKMSDPRETIYKFSGSYAKRVGR
jgi:hypothetical protein